MTTSPDLTAQVTLHHPSNPVRWRRSRRLLILVGIALALMFAEPAATTASPDPAAQATVAALANDSEAALATLPAGFEQTRGYRPVVATLADGTQRLVNPHGTCSTPGHTGVYNFALACQAHDFGYDLMRFVSHQGHPLGRAARRQIDLMLTHDLLAQCSVEHDVVGCHIAAHAIGGAVMFNDWRQGALPPTSGAGLVRTAGLIALALIGLTHATRSYIARRR